MNRRELMRSLFVAAPVAAMGEQSKTGPLLDKFKWNSWEIEWTGWKQLTNVYCECGQWIAILKDKPLTPPTVVATSFGYGSGPVYGAYSSIPGIVDWFFQGQCFDICLQEDQVYINPEISEDLRSHQKNRALHKLINFLRTSKVGC